MFLMAKEQLFMAKRKRGIKRLGQRLGGSHVSLDVWTYWQEQAARVAADEGLHKCTFPNLLTRIAMSKLDLTWDALHSYQNIKVKQKSEPALARATA
jgi:hypothetical protein